MLKPFLFLAITANVLYVVSSQDATWSDSDDDSSWSDEKCKTCRANEIYVNCPATVCVPKYCSEVGYPVPCVDLPPDGKCPVEPGCICKEGYVWNDKGICIPMQKCPSCGGDPNAVSGCGNCNRLCRNDDQEPIFCTEMCKVNGCDCREGYVLDENTGKCVLPKHCSKNCTKPNEVYDICPAPCPSRRCDIDDRTVDCVPPPKPGDPLCEPGCRCADGYYRNYEGICVTRDQCPKCTNPNEVFDVCPAPCPPQRCDVDPAVILCLVPPQPGDPECEPGCRCIDGYVRNSDGVCIPRDECPPQCGENEVYSDCINGGCHAQNCSQAGFPVPCVKPKICKKGCLCKDGYLRNDEGICIPQEKCASCGGDPNAHPGCGVNCGRHCSNFKETSVVCPLICNLNGCDCDKGYVFDDNIGKCVRPKDCTPTCNKPNEVYEPCPIDCPPSTCESLDRVYVCPVTKRRPPCNGGCRCKAGFFRNVNGDCVTEDDCRKCPGPHEYFACSGACDNVCENIHEQNQTHCPIINIKCNDMCYCEKNFARAANNTCIPIDKCDEPQCPFNERYEENPSSLCVPQNCNQLGYDLECPDPNIPDRPDCVCIHGYVRNDEGVCIPAYKCPSCAGDPNKEAGCGIYCNSRCSDINQEPQGCVLMCYPNGCECRKGHYLDENTGRCVLPGDCTSICGRNEVYSDCVNGGCQAKNCSQAGYPVPCVDPKICKKGCLCKDGYLRDENGVCIPRQECPSCGGDPNAHPGCGVNCGSHCNDYLGIPRPCPRICKVDGCDCDKGYYYDENTKKCVRPEQCAPICNKPHEVYEPCPFDCPPRTCDSLDKAYVCPIIEPRPPCKGGCRCAEGFFRNVNGDCVTEKDCRKCPGPHEFFACGGACDNVCETIHEQNQTHCPIINIRCNDMCYCEKNFARAANNTCIPIELCDEPQCPVNERYEENPSSLCVPQNCNQLGYDLECPDPNIPDRPDCVCIHGYVRNDDGVCIPANKCPSCAGDPNKEAGCGIYCNSRCSDINQEPQGCILMCYPNGCECRKGYYLDENTGRCVLPRDCTTICGKNEVYSDCVNGGCQAKNCSQAGYPVPCVDPKICKKGCLCKDGYLRDKNGVCIPRQECPSCGGDPNAHPGCGVNCGRRCSDYLGIPRPCPKICKVDGCDCDEGYYYDDNTKKCVRPEQCGPICGINEVYSKCINGGCDPKSCYQLGKPIPCDPIDPKHCIEGCLCKEGYLRADNGICVPERECKYQCRKPHQVYDPCPSTCPPQTCDSIGKVYDCAQQSKNPSHPQCKPGCVCEKGYYKNKINECISKEDCLKCQGPHEYFSCGVACDNVCATLSEQNQTNCPIVNIVCNKMCYCEKDYARAKNNTCIPISKCHETQCGVNEYYDMAPSLCKPQNCAQLNDPLSCLSSKKGCIGKPGCVCIANFVRNKKGVCRPITECPQYKELVCGKNEIPSDCVNGGCDKRNCTQLNQPTICIDPICCIKGCVCKYGYLRNNDGVCVPTEQCPCQTKCGRNEVPSDCVNGGCERRNCSQLGQPDMCIDPECCIKGCICREGYLRNDDGICVPIDKCPPICGKNEVYDTCIQGQCGPKNCSDLGFPIACPRIDPKHCIKGCLCKNGYVRADNGVCIPKEQCPSCGGDANARAGCGINCNRYCSDIGMPPRSCAAVCQDNGCDCKDGYYVNAKTGKCVLPKHCCKN